MSISFRHVCFLILFGAITLMADISHSKTANVIGDELKFKQMCNASGAVQITDDEIIVVSDEKDKLYFYNIAGGNPLDVLNLHKLLKLDKTDEMDLEAALKTKDKIWWLGSHSRDKEKRRARDRQVLFATNIPTDINDKVKVTFDELNILSILRQSEDVTKIVTQKKRHRAPKKGGVSIEGLAEHPDGGLLIAFRSPLTGKKGKEGNALIVYLVEKVESFEVKQTFELDLQDRGIRDIVLDGSKYLLISGNVNRGSKFDLYSWEIGKEPELIDTGDLLKDLNPEALVKLDNKWLILSDDGKALHNTKECKDFVRASTNFFRGRVFELAD